MTEPTARCRSREALAAASRSTAKRDPKTGKMVLSLRTKAEEAADYESDDDDDDERADGDRRLPKWCACRAAWWTNVSHSDSGQPAPSTFCDAASIPPTPPRRRTASVAFDLDRTSRPPAGSAPTVGSAFVRARLARWCSDFLCRSFARLTLHPARGARPPHVGAVVTKPRAPLSLARSATKQHAALLSVCRRARRGDGTTHDALALRRRAFPGISPATSRTRRRS